MHIEVRFNTRENAYQVVVMFRMPMEEMFETATHVALFESNADAVEMVSAIKKKFRETPYVERLNGVIDILDKRYWHAPASPAAAIRWESDVAPFRVAPKNLVA